MKSLDYISYLSKSKPRAIQGLGLRFQGLGFRVQASLEPPKKSDAKARKA